MCRILPEYSPVYSNLSSLSMIQLTSWPVEPPSIRSSVSLTPGVSLLSCYDNVDIQLFWDGVVSSFSGEDAEQSAVSKVHLEFLVRLKILTFDVSYRSSLRYVLRNDRLLFSKSFFALVCILFFKVLLLAHCSFKKIPHCFKFLLMYPFCMMMTEQQFCT